MMNLMIVDDENIIVEDIKSGVDWKKLGITNVYTASNIYVAKEIFNTQDISLLLCDIEMPQGNGLELLSWVRDHYTETETIFLTCHADFDYAVEAIRKGSFDFLLKPITYEDLEIVLIKAIKKLNTNMVTAEFGKIGRYWSKFQPILVERFWVDILNRNIASTSEAIKEAARERSIPYAEQMIFIPIYIKIRRYRNDIDPREEKHVEFVLKSKIDEIIVKTVENGLIIPNSKGSFFAILSMNSPSDCNEEALKKDCENFIEFCSQNLGCDLNCCIGKVKFAHDLPDQADKLIQLEKNNIAFENCVLYLGKYSCSAVEYLTPDFVMWTAMLAKGEVENAYLSICRYIDQTIRTTGYDFDAIKKFQLDFSQMIFSTLKQKNMQAHKILSDVKSEDLYSCATRSIIDLKAWIKHVTDKFNSCACMPNLSESMIDKAKKYIKQNIDQDLCRTDIAAYLHINPDYFTRIFNKEVGLSIPEFIMQERLKIAKEMILQTDMSISEIAVSVGYTNFSYFSKLFKEMFGLNPTALKLRK